MKLPSVFVALFFLVVQLPVHAEVPRQLRVCADSNDFAPFTYTGKHGVDGYNVDYLKGMLTPVGRHAAITRLPWIRCLALAAAGKYDIVLDAVKVTSRDAEFAYGRNHYSLTPIVMYRKGLKLPTIKAPADLGPFKQCQVLGWDYSLAGVPMVNDGVTKPTTQGAALEMLRSGRCQIMVYDLELIPGMRLLPGGDDDLAYVPLPWVTRADMYMMVSRALPYTRELVEMISTGVDRMEKSGEAARLLARHVQRANGLASP